MEKSMPPRGNAERDGREEKWNPLQEKKLNALTKVRTGIPYKGSSEHFLGGAPKEFAQNELGTRRKAKLTQEKGTNAHGKRGQTLSRQQRAGHSDLGGKKKTTRSAKHHETLGE